MRFEDRINNSSQDIYYIYISKYIFTLYGLSTFSSFISQLFEQIMAPESQLLIYINHSFSERRFLSWAVPVPVPTSPPLYCSKSAFFLLNFLSVEWEACEKMNEPFGVGIATAGKTGATRKKERKNNKDCERTCIADLAIGHRKFRWCCNIYFSI